MKRVSFLYILCILADSPANKALTKHFFSLPVKRFVANRKGLTLSSVPMDAGVLICYSLSDRGMIFFLGSDPLDCIFK